MSSFLEYKTPLKYKALLEYKAFDVLNKKAIIIVGYITFRYVTEESELGKVLKKRALNKATKAPTSPPAIKSEGNNVP